MPVSDVINAVEHKGRREDAQALLTMYDKIFNVTPVIWGTSVIGYGNYEYTRADGSHHKFLAAGFSPRKANLVVYLMAGCDQHTKKFGFLGPHKHSVSCLYLGRLARINLDRLSEIVADDAAAMRARYGDIGLG